MEYLTRSKAAFRLSVNTFFEQARKFGEKVYFWTFTFEKPQSVPDAFKLWNKFAKALWRYGLHPETGEQTIVGIRVAEFHPGGHGVHFHVLVNRRIPIHAVRRLAEKYGFWWIDVKKIKNRNGSATPSADVGRYLGKYLSKSDRPGCFRGRRLWQAFGQWGHTKCKDVVVESEFVAAFHHRRKLLEMERKVAELQHREYRMEGSLETMAWAEDHCFRVRTGDRAPLRPDLWYSPPEDEQRPSMGFKDWESQFDELLHGRN